jgi:regulator of sigma E protease
MDTVVTILSLALALSLMIFVHEVGHLVAAKRSKVVVKEFGIGYPPRLLTLWRAEGKIVIAGREIVIPRKFDLPDGLHGRSKVLYETRTDEKGRAVLAHIQVVEADEAAAEAASQVELLDAGTIYSINAIPFGGFTLMLGEEDPSFPGSLASKSKRTRVFVLAAGAGMNLLTAVAFFALALGLGAPAVADPENAMVASVAPGSPAELAGLLVGDVIVRANDTEILTVDSLVEFTPAHVGTDVVLTVERGEEILRITVVPRADPPAGEAPIGIGLSPRTTIKRYPWYEALWLGLKETANLAALIVTVPVQIIRGLIPADLARPVGPVGVGQLVGDAVLVSLDTGWWFPVMQTMGLLSVALAVTNLLPLPGFDGGRILFILVEAIRGRRVDPAKEGLVHLIGMALLVALMVLITWQDVVNPLPTVDWASFF